MQKPTIRPPPHTQTTPGPSQRNRARKVWAAVFFCIDGGLGRFLCWGVGGGKARVGATAGGPRDPPAAALAALLFAPHRLGDGHLLLTVGAGYANSCGHTGKSFWAVCRRS